MSNQNWLAGLKEGDEVALKTGSWGEPVLRTVGRTTATLIVVDNNKYRRDTGRMVGSRGYTVARLLEPTAEIRDAIRRAALIAGIERAKWAALPTDALEQIAAIIEAHRKPA